MNKKLKAILCSVLIVGSLNFSTAAFAGTIPDSATPLKMSDVIECIDGNNTDLNLLRRKVLMAENRALDANRDASNPKSSSGFSTDIMVRVTPKQKEKDKYDLEYQRDEKQDALELEATQLYYKLLLGQQQIEVQNNKIARLGALVDQKKQKIDLGASESYTLINDQATLKDAETALIDLKHTQEINMMALNLDMGTDIKTQWNLEKVEVPEVSLNISSLDSIISKMTNDYHTVKSLEKAIDISNDEKNIAEDYAGKTEDVNYVGGETNYKDQADQYKDDIANNQAALSDEKVNIETKIRTDYNNLLSLKDEMDAQKLEYDKNVEELKAQKTRLDVGMITDIDYKATEEAVKAAEVTYKSAKLDYYIAAQNFLKYIKIAI